MTRVLRMGRGDRFILMDGKGARFQAIILSAGRREVLVALEKALPQPPPSPVEITLCQALLKSRAMDYVVEKTSELGVNRIYPFSSERTVVRIHGENSANKRRRWREIAQGATKQSNKSSPAEIGPLSSFGELLAKCRQENALKVILWEEEGARDLKGLLKASPPFTPTPVLSTGQALPSPSRGRDRPARHRSRSGEAGGEGVKKFIGIVGPEGGFSQEEVRAAKDAGFTSVSLGQRVLRAETAAITLVAVVQYEWGDLSLVNL